MKNELLPANLDSFKERFSTLHDGLIRAIEIRSLQPVKDSISVLIETPDLATRRWVKLLLEFEEIIWFIIRQPERYISSVIFEASIDFIEDKMYVDFNSQGVIQTEAAYYEKQLTDGGRSLVIVAKKGFWSVELTDHKFDIS